MAEGARGTNDRKLLYTVTVPDTMRALTEAVDGRKPVQVWDRLFYSEFVYHDLVGRKCEFGDALKSHVQSIIESLTCPVIYCCAPLEVVKANIAGTDQMKGVNEHIDTIWGRYVSLVEDEIFPAQTLCYDYTGTCTGIAGVDVTSDLDDVFNEVADYIDMRSARSWQ